MITCKTMRGPIAACAAVILALNDLHDGSALATESNAVPSRIVSILPSLTEIVFDLGAGDRIVGVSDYCEIPSGPSPPPRVGGLIPDVERIVSLKPDVILADASQARGLARAKDLGLRVELTQSTRVDSVPAVYDLIRHVATIIGRKVEAERVVQGMQQSIQSIEDRVRPFPRPNVMSVLWWEPLMIAGPNSLQNAIIWSAGGRNIGDQLKGTSVTVSDEFVVSRNPDVILVSEPQDVDRAIRRPGWSGLNAVKGRRVIHIGGDKLARYGSRLAGAVRELSERLHPPQPADEDVRR